MSEVLLVYTTWPDAGTAEAAARTIVDERLAACANILAPIRSVYRWNGAVEEATETPMLLKTAAASAERLRDRLLELHPFETPCIVALEVEAAASNPAFLAWLLAETA